MKSSFNQMSGFLIHQHGPPHRRPPAQGKVVALAIGSSRLARSPSSPLTPRPPLSFLQRAEHHGGAPLATLEEAPLAHLGLEDFGAALAAHARRVREIHLQGNVVARLDRVAMGKLKVRFCFS